MGIRRKVDVDVLAQALIGALRDGASALLAKYWDTVLPRLWRYQEFSVWMTDFMYDAGNPSINGPFRQMAACARLDEMFNSPTEGRLHSDFQRGFA